MADPDQPRHKAQFTGQNTPGAEDGRLIHPTAFRNVPPLIVALYRIFGDAPGTVLEIGAGTGQQAASFALAFPNLAWWPSDPIPEHRRSISAWQAFCRAPERVPMDIDATDDWATRPDIKALGPLAAVLSMNVIHIAPFQVAKGIIAGAADVLAPGGRLLFYGPFHEDGRPTGPGNASFDAHLRAEDPSWGIRDVSEVSSVAQTKGLTGPEVLKMPADNRLVLFTKT